MSTTTKLLDCGHTPTPQGCSAGWSEDQDGRTWCLPCSSARERARIVLAQPGSKVLAYVSSDGRTITDWPGSELMNRVTWGRQHSRSDTRRHLTAVDPYGRIWAGTGDEGMWCCLRLTGKSVRREVK